MWNKVRNKELYFLVLASIFFVCLAALGGGIFEQSGMWFSHWQHKAFNGLCHQDPQRSFWINGTPMAVCSRCFGIYSGFALVWVLLPLQANWISGRIRERAKWILLGLVLINAIDITGNIIGLWENTLLSRILMGGLIGISAALIIGCGFTVNQQQNEKYYGTVRTSN